MVENNEAEEEERWKSLPIAPYSIIRVGGGRGYVVVISKGSVSRGKPYREGLMGMVNGDGHYVEEPRKMTLRRAVELVSKLNDAWWASGEV